MSWSQKAAIARTHRRLKSIRAKVEAVTMEIAGDWSDEDQFICNQMDELRDTVNDMTVKIAKDMDEAQAERAAGAA